MRKTAVFSCVIVLLGVVFWLVFRLRHDEKSDKHRETSDIQRAEFIKIKDSLENGYNPWPGRRLIQDISRALTNPTLPPYQRSMLEFRLGAQLLRVGETEAVIAHCDAGIRNCKSNGLPVPDETNAWLGIAYWRLAEVSNCINLHNRDCCIFLFTEAADIR